MRAVAGMRVGLYEWERGEQLTLDDTRYTGYDGGEDEASYSRLLDL